MPRQIFTYDPPDRFVAGTVGEPGSRTFFLQATAGGRTTSVALEKQQVSVLAERVEALLDEVVRRTGGETSVPQCVGFEVEELTVMLTPVGLHDQTFGAVDEVDPADPRHCVAEIDLASRLRETCGP